MKSKIVLFGFFSLFSIYVFFAFSKDYSFAEILLAKSPIDWSSSLSLKDEYFENKNLKKNSVNVSVINAEELDSALVSSADNISESRFYIRVSNNTEKNMPMLSISTGIKEGTLNYIRVEGATGYVFENGILILKYVSLAPGESEDIVITGLPLISEKTVSLDIAPKVFDKNNVLVASGEKSVKNIKAKNSSVLDKFRFTNFFKKELEPKSEQ